MLLSNEADLAWQVAAEITPHLTRDEKSAVYPTIGCDDILKAIVDMLALAQNSRISLSNNTFGSIMRWLDGYIGSAEEPVIRKLLNQIDVQTGWTPTSPILSPAVVDRNPPVRSAG